MQTPALLSRRTGMFALRLFSLIALFGASSSFAQFVAFNDHAPGTGTTHPNTTIYSADSGQAGGTTGFLTNVSNGTRLSVTLAVTAASVTYEGTQGSPSPGTPLYTNFNGFVDFQGTPNPSIALNGAGSSYTYTFTGLNPNKRYTFRGGAVRAGGYVDRWTLCEIVGADSYTSAHTANALTTAQVPGITASQAAFNFGSNDSPTSGDMADWENINPGPDGSFTVVSSQYLGTVPGGSSAGSKGYAITGVRLEEFNTTPVAAAITNQPQNTTVTEAQPATFTVGTVGNPPPTFQWYRDEAAITDATNSSYTVASPLLSESGAVFKVIVSNVTNSVTNTVISSNAVLTVVADTNAPTLVRAASISENSVLVTFSEPVTELTATNKSNYAITNGGVSLTISNALLQVNGSNVVLTTSLQAQSVTYTLVVNGIKDRSSAANQIAANSTTTFATASGYSSQDVGNPGVAGSLTQVPGGFDLAGSGADIGGSSDQFTFAYQQRGNTDFDVKVRVQGLTQPDTWTKAGIMARQSTNANAMFAGAFATPGLGGCFFESRATVGANATLQGSAAVNYPSTWLRLQHVGTTFTGYVSFDGATWLQLGTATIAMTDPILLGYVVTSHTNSTTATAQFRDVSNVTGATTVTSLASPVEPPGPSSRRCPFAITEIMYKPAARPDAKNLEFVEIYNSNPFFEDISGYRLSGDIDYTFPPNTIMPGGSYLVVAKIPADVQSVYGISGVLGPYTGALTPSGTLRLRNQLGHIYLEIPYSSEPPWPVAPNGTGHSLVLARPSYGEAYPQAWGPSDSFGGSPGQFDGYTAEPMRSVVINEFLANTTNAGTEFIELYNHANQPLNISGAYLTDDPATNKFRIPDTTTIPARGFVSFTEAQLGFSLNAEGESIFLVNSNRTRVIDALSFGGQAAETSSGRFPDGAPQIYPLKTTTPGGTNTGILIHDIVINELMYNPITENNDDEYIELYNKGTNPIDLNGWKFLAGVNFIFTNTTIIAPDNYIVVAKNKTNLLAHYGNLNNNNTRGDYGGSLRNGGERLALSRPEQHLNAIVTTNMSQLVTNYTTNTLDVVVDELTYVGGSGQWGKWSGGGGSSLELIDPRSNHRLPSNWADSDETHKATWTTIEATGILDLGTTYNANSEPINRLEVSLLNEGEALLDNVEVINNSSAGAAMLNPVNSTFDSGSPVAPSTGTPPAGGPWNPLGDHVRSTLETTEGYPGPTGRSLHIRASARGDTGVNAIRVPFGNFGVNNTTNLTAGNSVTVRAKARWLTGWPEILLRIKGNYFEATGPMNIPTNLGTPGAPNSRAATNAPPAIYQVTHTPVLPPANTPVLVSARVEDPDGIASVQLKYRLDPAGQYTTTNMLDDGTSGDLIANDGIYSATIPPQAANAMVAFIIQATDPLLPSLTSTFPAGAYNSQTAPPVGRAPLPGEPATGREALIRYGEPVNARTDGVTTPSTFGIYRYWLTQNSVNTWINRPSLSNERIEGTFVYGNFRAIYNIGGKYAGSPYHQGFSSPVANLCHYSLDLPSDDLLLGTENFNKLHAPGNGAWDDTTCQREQACYWLVRQLNLPWNYRRSINFIINGARRGGNALMEDSVTPGSDVIDSVFPDDSEGNLYKLQPWFEFSDTVSTINVNNNFQNVSWCVMNNFTTTGGAKKLARYRHNYLARAVKGSANDYSDVFNLVDAVNAPATPATAAAWSQGVEALVDTEEWLRIFAVEHAVGNWDSFGNRNSQNMYGYKPTNGKWTLMIWDYNIVLNNSGSDGPGAQLFQYQTADVNMPKLYNIGGSYGTWQYRRAYWRGLKEIATTHMANPLFFAMLDAKYNAYQANGLTAIASPQVIKDFCNAARPSILSQLAADGDPGAFTAGTNSFITVSNNLLTITGTAPVDAKTIKANGIEYPITWTGLSTWTMLIAVPTGNSTLAFQAYDLKGLPIPGATGNINVTYTGPVVLPQDALVINEIMFRPAVSNAAYVEILNNSTLASFDLSNWKLDGIDYTFPPGTVIGNKQILVIAKNRTAFAAAYGSTISVFGQFDGNLDPEGEILALVKPPSNPSDIEQIIDAVRYENIAPWPASATNGGVALQLIDASQDDSRVSNWSDGSGWRFYSVTGQPATSGGAATVAFTFTMDSAGDFYIDDLSLVAGSVPATGPNLFNNGDFETGSLPAWQALGNHSASTISTAIKHAGNASLHVIASNAGSVPANTLVQSNISIIQSNVYSLSFWYLPNANANNLNYRLTSNFRSGVNQNFPVPSLKPSVASPGSNNTTAVSIEAYPLLWINEVEPNNTTGITDNNAERDPWIELFNSGPTPITLDGYALANNYTNLGQWPFPNGTTINPGEFKVLFADGQPGQSSGNELHTNFRLDAVNGSIVLSKLPAGPGDPRILDYINYTGMEPNFSYGSYPDGQVVYRQRFYYNTPGASNNPAPIPVIINEWLASNTNSIVDPANGRYEDWIELYNFGTTTIDLSGYWLTDNLSQKKNWQIPNGTVIGPGAFLLIWADNAATNSTPTNLHAGFQLSRNGEEIGLFTPEPELLRVDAVAFGPQGNNISQGRYPDGNFAGVLYFMTTPTPAGANVIPANQYVPVLPGIANRVMTERATLNLTVLASDDDVPVQTLTYSLDPGAPAGASINARSGLFTWTPSEAQGGVVYPVTIRVSDNGSPTFSDSKSFTITVNKTNSAPDVPLLAPRTLPENTSLSFTVAASDSDLPAQQLSFALTGAPSGATIDASSGLFSWTPTETQGPSTNNIQVRVSDNGSPSMTTTQILTIFVTEVNSVPLLTNPGTVAIDELKGYTNFLVATDSDMPTNTLTFALVQPFVSGVQLNSQSGRLTWTPTEAQGPSNYVVTVKVTDNGSPSLSVTQAFTIIVAEVNSAPVLTNLNNSIRTNNELTSITLTNRATDSDVPTNNLTYQLLSAPSGATLDTVSGLFSWTPSVGQGPSSNNIVVRVFDNGSPSLSATQRFAIIVAVTDPRITDVHSVSATQLSISWQIQSGQTYELQYCDDLTTGPTCWQPLTGAQITTSGSTQTATIDISGNPNPQRFYRVAKIN